MRLKDIYQTHNPAISVEFFPPRNAEGDADLSARIPEIARWNPAFCSVTYGAGGSARDRTLFWAKRVKHEFGLEVMCHLTCVGQSREETRNTLSQLQENGIENIIALRGDPPKGVDRWEPHPEGYHYASELVAVAKEMGFGVAVAGFPETHPESPSREEGLKHLKTKVDAGADAIITQLFFNNDDYFAYVKALETAGVNVPVIPGILPFRNSDELTRFTTRYARTFSGPANVPPPLRNELVALNGDADGEAKLGIDWAVRQCRELLAAGAPGIHLYCMNKSNVVEGILSQLDLA